MHRITALTDVPSLAAKPYHIFLTELHSACPFSHLVLGEGASLGYNRKGTPQKITELGTLLGYTAHFIPKLIKGGEPYSSTSLRP